MLLQTIFDRFVAKSPVTMMARLTMERALAPAMLDALFETHREQTYTKKLLFSST